MTVYLWDTHSHLYQIPHWEELLPKLEEERIKVIVVGEERKSNEKVKEICKKFPKLLYPAFGLHPYLLPQLDVKRELEWLEENLSTATAVGEVGLDFKGEEAKDSQIEVFLTLLDLAKKFDLPVIIHSRKAARECVEVVRDSGWRKVVFHWFTAPSLVEDIVELDGYFSVGPQASLSHSYRKVVEKAPLERIILETDSPVSLKGIPTSPLQVKEAVKVVSLLKGEPMEKVVEITSGNVYKIFGLK